MLKPKPLFKSRKGSRKRSRERMMERSRWRWRESWRENGECVCVQLKRLSSWPHKGRNSEEDLVIEIQKNSQRLWARVEEWRCSSRGRGGGRGQGGEDDVEVQGGGRGQGVQLQVQDQLNLIINIQWIIVNWFLFWKIQFFFTCERREKSGGGEGSKYKSKVEDRLKLTDNIFAYHTFIYPKKSKSEPWT